MKNLEKEYKEQISLETPDLWSRIEAGVDAYEASKTAATPVTAETPAAPAEARKDNIVKFNSKKFFDILGKISVAAILFLVVAATYNVARHSRKDAATAPSPAEATITDIQHSAAEATQSEAEAPHKEVEASQGAAEVSLPDSFKEAEPAEMTDSPAINESPSFEADVTLENSTSQFSVDRTAKNLDLSAGEALKLFKALTEIGLNDITDLTAVEGGADGSVIYGPDFKDLSLSVASFKAGKDKTSYLLYYSTEYGMDIFAVQDEETGEFIYINPTE